MTLPDRFVWRPQDVLRSLGAALDLVPYLALLALPFVFGAWALGTPGISNPDSAYEIWWTRGMIATVLYAPSMAVCALVEWLSRRRGWWRLRIGVRVFRWAHFLAVYGPIGALFASIALPPAWQPF